MCVRYENEIWENFVKADIFVYGSLREHKFYEYLIR